MLRLTCDFLLRPESPAAMQVDTDTQFSPPTPAPSHSSPPPTHAHPQKTYTFPPSKSGTPEPRSVSPSELSGRSEYGGDGEGQKSRVNSSGQQSQASYDPSALPQSQNPRMSIPNGMVASYDARMYSQDDSGPPPAEYSALGRQIVSGQRLPNGYGFPEHYTYGSQATPFPPPHPGVQYHTHPPHPEFLQRPGPHMYGPPPGLQSHWSDPGQPMHPHMHQQMIHHPYPPGSLPPNGGRYVYPNEGQQRMVGGQPFFTPYNPANLMARQTSGDSSTTSHLSDSENRSWSSSQDHSSDYEGAGVCNPAYINANASTSSGPDAHGGGAMFYPGGHPFSRSTSDLHSLRLEDGMDASTMRQRGLHRDATVRGTRSSTSGTSRGAKPATRTTARAIFHPSPQSMLAPAIASARRAGKIFGGSTTPSLPTDDEFARMPTKRSRGRRPPCTPDLALAADPNLNPSEAQIRYCGVTKTGKPKKVCCFFPSFHALSLSKLL